MRVAIGLKARTGRAIVVAVGGDLREPHFIERAEFKLLPDGAFAPYHAAEKLAPAAARESVARDIAAAQQLAAAGIRAVAKRINDAGHDLLGCAVLVGPGMPAWTTEQIIAVHVRMHQAEGELFRNVLVEGARECGLNLTSLCEKSVLDDSARLSNVSRARIDAMVAALGKSAGPPWGKDQKEAAAAALTVCGAQPE
jgi:hypothetical protein